jgi:hypothetical protein
VASFAGAVVECDDPDLTQVLLDGTASFDLDSTPGTDDDIEVYEWFEDFGGANELVLGNGSSLLTSFGLGAHAVTFGVTDGAGLTSTATATVAVVDTTPPEIFLSHDPTSLWPPNHRMVSVDLTVLATDTCSSPSTQLSLAASNEPDDAAGSGDGETVMDVQDASIGTPDTQILLRAERDRDGNGRVYTLSYLATDGSGNQTGGDETVDAPLDVNGLVEPLSIALSEMQQGTQVSWTTVPGAVEYNVIRGNLGDLTVTADSIDLGSVTCLEAGSTDTITAGDEDSQVPVSTQTFFYLVDFDDGRRSGYGTETAPKPRVPTAGDCF